MAHDYDVENVSRQVIGHAGAMSRLKFKDHGNDLVATVSATFRKTIIHINVFAERNGSRSFQETIIDKIGTKKRNNCRKREKQMKTKHRP